MSGAAPIADCIELSISHIYTIDCTKRTLCCFRGDHAGNHLFDHARDSSFQGTRSSCLILKRGERSKGHPKDLQRTFKGHSRDMLIMFRTETPRTTFHYCGSVEPRTRPDDTRRRGRIFLRRKGSRQRCQGRCPKSKPRLDMSSFRNGSLVFCAPAI